MRYEDSTLLNMFSLIAWAAVSTSFGKFDG